MISARISDSENLNATMGSDSEPMSANIDGLLNPGPPGKDGITPTIGENGNWFLGDTDTGKPSRGDTGEAGPQGPKGDTGEKGETGPSGKSAYQYAKDGGYAGTEAEFSSKLAEEPLSGTTDTLTPTQVYDAIKSGRPVLVQHTDSTFGVFNFSAFNISETMSVIVSNSITLSSGVYILGDLVGNKSSNAWSFYYTFLAEKKDIPDIPVALPNPNYLTFTGAVTGTYNGSSPMTVEIPDAVTDDHINSLINTALGVVENGSY